MNKRLIIVGAIVLIGGGALAWQQLSGSGDRARLHLYGNVDIREVDLAFRVPGRIEALAVDEGDAVAAGDRLAQLDDAPYRDALAAADAGVAQAQAELSKLRAGPRPQELRVAEARLAEGQAALENAERELARQREMMVDEATTQRELDAAIAQQAVARARVHALEQQLALLEAGFRDEDIAAGEARLGQAQARLQEATTRLDDTELLAPSAGTIITRAREPGAVVGQGQTVLTLSLDRPVWVRAYVDEPHLGRVHPGLQVELRTDSSERTFSGRVGFISPRAEFTPKTVETEALRSDLVYRLRIVVDEPDESLRQGMPVTVILPDEG